MGQDNGYWRSDALGDAHALLGGRLRYHDTGAGPPIVFVHGALVNANLWRKVVAELASDFRCIALDMPFGAHVEAMPADADLSPPAVADLVAAALEALDLERVTLVGNDTGGAICQLVITRHPERIDRLVLTSCDAFENFPPKLIKPLMPVLRLPGAVSAMLAPTRSKSIRNRVFGLFVKRPIEQEAVDSYALPPLRDAGVRRDIRKFLTGLDKRYTLAAADRFSGFRKPALIAWSREGERGMFPAKYGERLADALPDARLEWIEDSLFFSPEDRPDRVAELIRRFVREPATVA
jgi:pimeloyl-ACP methyl ester carboxylesterase